MVFEIDVDFIEYNVVFGDVWFVSVDGWECWDLDDVDILL